jgi:hypothetical protein
MYNRSNLNWVKLTRGLNVKILKSTKILHAMSFASFVHFSNHLSVNEANYLLTERINCKPRLLKSTG